MNVDKLIKLIESFGVWRRWEGEQLSNSGKLSGMHRAEGDGELRKIRAALAGVGQWLPIADVPSDHFPRLYLSRQKVFHGFVDVTGQLMFYTELGYRKARRKPTHWQPLPAPPDAVGGSS